MSDCIMEYRRSIVTFLDVLAFRELLQVKTAAQIDKLLNQLQTHTKPDDFDAEELEIQFQAFSDCAVRWVPLNSPSNSAHPSGILFTELLNLVHAQSQLIVDGCFVRGGMTIGNICGNASVVFGPAMIDAYGIESDCAIYPRIVIDPQVFVAHDEESLLRSRIHDVEDEHKYFQDIVRKDTDGVYFIDYLRGMTSECDDEDKLFTFISHHKNRILEHASEHPAMSKVACKWLWLATYHNTFIRELGEATFTKCGIDRDDYLISPVAMPLLYELSDRYDE